jgi:tRNA-Thr(GGU) m(6)t(6)A37 methyltransferase TsaA
MKSIGIIHSPFFQPEDIPMPSFRNNNVELCVELDEEYSEGLQDLDGFSHAIILFNFHLSFEVHLKGKPSFEKKEHGVFSIRSPHRPNHIGLTVIKIKRIENNKLFFSEGDMINNTPVLDIKPYVRDTDSKNNAVCGWLEKHLNNRNTNLK